MSKVSVVIPIYNPGKKLKKCIKSILNQTFTDFELILVNDGSTDNSLEVCRKYLKNDRRITVINKKNEGTIATRKKGIEASSSNYIMFVDADDFINKRSLEILYNELVKSDVEILVYNTYKVVGNGTFIKRKNQSIYFNKNKIYNNHEIRAELVEAYFHGRPFPATLHGKLYKRELLIDSGKYLNKIHFFGDDLFYNMELFLKAKRVKVINIPLYYYRIGGFTSQYMPYLFDDMVNGYQIQKEVIELYYQNTREKQYNGISIMLLNTFKTCLYNLWNGELSKEEIKNKLRNYVENENILECLQNEGSKNYFQQDFLHAIKNKDIDYLYRFGQNSYNKNKPKKMAVNLLSKLSII